MDAEFADICDAVAATQRIKHKTRLLLQRKHAPQLVSQPCCIFEHPSLVWHVVQSCSLSEIDFL